MAAIGRLIVTLAADVVGYSSLIGADEKGALERLEAHRRQFVCPKIAEHYGRIVKATGGSLLVEFGSPIEAVQCAVEVQRGMVDRNVGTAPDRRITFRVGVHIGEAMANGDDLVSRAVAAMPIDTLATLIKPGTGIYGDGGDIAVRVAALADPSGICISDAVRDAIRDQLPYTFQDIGKQNLDIRAAPVRCYAMSADSVASRPRAAVQNHRGSASRRMWLPSAAVAASAFAIVGVCSVALWSWLGVNSSTAPTPVSVTVASHMPAISNTVADNGRQTPTPPEPPVASNVSAVSATRAPSAPQSPPASNTAPDRRLRTPSASSALSDIGATVIRGKQAPRALQTTPDSGTVVRGVQAPSVPQTAADGGTAVLRGK